MKRVISVVTLALLFTCCAGNTPKDSNFVDSAPKWQLAQPDSVNAALVGIRNPRQANKLLHSKSRTEFDSLLAKFQMGFSKPNWNEMKARYDTIESNSLCRTSITAPKGKRDLRIDEFVRRGFPTGKWILGGEAIETGEPLNFFEYSWGKETVMFRGEDYPIGICPVPLVKLGIGSRFPHGFSPLDLRVKTPVFLKGSGGTYDVLVSSEIGLDKINLETFRGGFLRFTSEIYDSTSRLVTEINHRVWLEPYLQIAGAAMNRDQFYVLDHAVLHLPAGRYEVKVKAIGEGSCEGEQSFPFQVPFRTSVGVDIGDLLFIDPNPPTGDLNNLVSRWDRNDLWATSTFPSGFAATALTEATADKRGAYLVSVWLTPRRTDQKRDASDTIKLTLFSDLRFVDGPTALELPILFGAPPGSYWLNTSINQPGTLVRSVSVSKVEVERARIDLAFLETKAKVDEFSEVRESSTPALSNSEKTDQMTDSELRETIKIITPKLYRDIRKFTNTEFRAAVELYKAQRDFAERPDTPVKNEWWDEMISRWQWGNANLKTRIDAFPRDIRWEFVLLLGTDVEMQPREIAGESGFPVHLWVCRWKKRGELFAFEADKGGVIPVKIHPWSEDEELVFDNPLHNDPALGVNTAITSTKKADEILGEEPKFAAFKEVDKPLNSIPSISCQLPTDEASSEFEIWVTTWTDLSQFSDSALSNDSLTVRVAVYRPNAEFVGEVAETLSILGPSFKWLARESKGERRKRVIPTYTGIRLQSGKYEAVVSVSGDRGRNLAVYPIPLDVPPRSASWIETDPAIRGTSDIIFPINGLEPVGYGIILGEEAYSNNPSPIFGRQDSLPVVMQAQVPPSSTYQVVVAFVRIPGEDLFQPISSRTHASEEQVVFKKLFHAGETGREIFKANLDLSVLTGPGRYAVVIRAMDPMLAPTSDQPYGISYRLFNIR